MECDVAVLGGGPGGYPAAIRAAQLGARVALIEAESHRRDVHHRGLHPHEDLGADRARAQGGERPRSPSSASGSPRRSSTSPRHRPTSRGSSTGLVNGITGVVKANEVAIVSGRGAFTDANTIAVEGAEDVRFQSAIVATGSQSLRPPVDGIDGPRCVDSTGLLAIERGAQAAGHPRRRRDRGRVRVDPRALRDRGDVVEMLDHLIPMEDEDASKELERAFKKRKIAVHLGARATRVEDSGGAATLHFEGKDGSGGERRGRPRAGGDRPRPAGARHRSRGGRRGVRPPPRRHRRSPHAHERRPHLRRRRRRGRLSARPHGLPRGRDRGRERARPRRRRSTTRPCRGASTPTPRSPPSA